MLGRVVGGAGTPGVQRPEAVEPLRSRGLLTDEVGEEDRQRLGCGENRRQVLPVTVDRPRRGGQLRDGHRVSRRGGPGTVDEHGGVIGGRLEVGTSGGTQGPPPRVRAGGQRLELGLGSPQLVLGVVMTCLGRRDVRGTDSVRSDRRQRVLSCTAHRTGIPVRQSARQLAGDPVQPALAEVEQLRSAGRARARGARRAGDATRRHAPRPARRGRAAPTARCAVARRRSSSATRAPSTASPSASSSSLRCSVSAWESRTTNASVRCGDLRGAGGELVAAAGPVSGVIDLARHGGDRVVEGADAVDDPGHIALGIGEVLDHRAGEPCSRERAAGFPRPARPRPPRRSPPGRGRRGDRSGPRPAGRPRASAPAPRGGMPALPGRRASPALGSRGDGARRPSVRPSVPRPRRARAPLPRRTPPSSTSSGR